MEGTCRECGDSYEINRYLNDGFCDDCREFLNLDNGTKGLMIESSDSDELARTMKIYGGFVQAGLDNKIHTKSVVLSAPSRDVAELIAKEILYFSYPPDEGYYSHIYDLTLFDPEADNVVAFVASSGRSPVTIN